MDKINVTLELFRGIKYEEILKKLGWDKLPQPVFPLWFKVGEYYKKKIRR